MTFDPQIFGFVGLIVTIVALALSLFQFRQSKQHASQLEAISQSVSTKYLGRFPEYLSALTAVIEDATRELVIVCAIPAHGSYSSPRWYLKYRQAIEQKIADGVEVRIVVSSGAAKEKILTEQFAEAARNWKPWFEANSGKLREVLVPAYCQEGDLAGLDYDRLMQHFEQMDAEALRLFKGAASVDELDESLQLWFWVIDGKEAIFVVPSFTTDRSDELHRVYGFRTFDPRLIGSFLELVSVLRARAGR